MNAKDLQTYKKFKDQITLSESVYETAYYEGEFKGMEKGIEQGIEKGREEGIEQGIEKGIEKVVISMLKQKIDDSLIQSVTGFSQNELNKLKNKL